MSDQRRVLFVCLGNICRSPTAEWMLKKELADAGRADDFVVRSAGLIARGHDVADYHAVQMAADHGIDVRHHLSTKLTRELLLEQDLIVAMDRMIAEHILNMTPDRSDRLRLHLEHTDDELDVIDPIGQSIDVFRASYDQIAAGMPGILAELGLKSGD